MLLFSTLLEINDTMTKDSFIQLVLEWNQGSPHEENIIRGITWNGEHNVRYGTDSLSLDIEEYRNENIIAVRYKKIANDGVVWNTDYVMNFNDMKMSIQLDRSYLEEALIIDPAFSTPHFITLLIEHNYLKNDGDLPILRNPVFVNEDNINILTNIINGQTKYRLPVVYISKTYHGDDPVDIWKLSSRLKGVAHVLVQERTRLNSIIRKSCNDSNEFYGAIGIYFPHSAFNHKRYLYRAYDGIDTILFEKVIRSVIQYSNAQMMDKLYTWQGVSNALLRDRLSSKGEELLAVQSEKNRVTAEVDELIELVDADMEKLKKRIEALTQANEALTYENQGLRLKISNADNLPILYLGEEEEFFHDEIKGIILEALESALPKYDSNSRRRDVLQDIIKSNPCDKRFLERSELLKRQLKGYRNISGTMKHTLKDMGFVITEEGKHCKLTYYGDSRYMATLAKTPSDGRSGINVATEIIKKMF